MNEMWAQGMRISSGYITPDTKVVFRSPTAMVYLFIQMSSEMWSFDVYGELFFEKAVDGFLAEMFRRWETTGSSHEVTIVLYSRCFYHATSIDEFPERMRDCLQMGYNNCFYEDFYRVVVQVSKKHTWYFFNPKNQTIFRKMAAFALTKMRFGRKYFLMKWIYPIDDLFKKAILAKNLLKDLN